MEASEELLAGKQRVFDDRPYEDKTVRYFDTSEYEKFCAANNLCRVVGCTALQYPYCGGHDAP